MRRSKYNYILSLTYMVSFSISCSTTKPAFPEKYNKASQVNGVVSKPGSPLAKQGNKNLEQPEHELQESLRHLYEQLLDPNYSLMDEDISVISSIPTPPKENSIAEAVLALGNLKFVHRSAENNSSATVPEGASKPTEGVNLSIEEQFQATQMDLHSLLRNNPHLQDIVVFQNIAKTLRYSTDSQEYRDLLVDSISQKVAMWQDLQKEFSQMVPSLAVETSDVEDNSVDPSQYKAADLLYGDSILMQAKLFAENGNFKSAITKAKKVLGKDPYYPAAVEKIKYFSNLAVQDLRQKAAQAFQSSLPVVDIKTKAAYLEEAKNYLEEALNEFPAADHLSTVKENLAVITNDLETISEETSQ